MSTCIPVVRRFNMIVLCQQGEIPLFFFKRTGFYLFCLPGLPQLKNFATSMLVRGHNHARLVRRLHADNFEQKFIAWSAWTH